MAERFHLDLGTTRSEVARLDSFDAETWADAPELAERYRGLDDEALVQVFERAAGARDLKRIVAAGEPLFARGALIRAWIYLYGRALAAQGRRAEAAEAFDHPAVRNRSGNPKYVQARALALAAVGRHAEAGLSLDQARADNPKLGLEDLRQTIAVLEALADREADLDQWPDMRRLAEAWLAVDAKDRAAALLSRVAGRLTETDLLDWAALALRVCAPEEVLDVLENVGGPDRTTPRWRTLTCAAATLCDPIRPPKDMPGDEPGPRFWRAIASERMGDLDAAIVELCALADTYREDYVIRCSLARAVGKSVLAATRPRFAPGGAGRVINIVPFFNELDLLRLHLEEMAPWVHRFVVTEAVQTFTGNAKPLIFEENRSLFADFEDKIVHFPIRAFPAHLTSPWSREFYQRDMAIAGASGLCGAEDYILETDVDEVIDGRVLEGLDADFAALNVRLARYFLNYCPGPKHPEHLIPKSTIFKARRRQRH
ncbi:MAG TPA: hypothetical protein VHX64_03580, partial [Caulobacteraceae bacterium]|nr:hypothetical protein [Caulobacteraceae bacterium]